MTVNIINQMKTIVADLGLNTHGWCFVKMDICKDDTCHQWRVRVDPNIQSRPITENQANRMADAFRAGLCSSVCASVGVSSNHRSLGGPKADKIYDNYDVVVYAHDSLEFRRTAEKALWNKFGITRHHDDLWLLGDIIETSCPDAVAELRIKYAGDAEKVAWLERLIVACNSLPPKDNALLRAA